MSHYTYLSEGLIGKSTRNKPIMPITESTIREKHKVSHTKSKKWFERLFSSEPAKVKPVIINQKTQEEIYYEKYGIIYNGSDLSSCINSVL